MHPALFAATLNHRSNPGIALNFYGTSIAFSFLAKSDQQSWCQNMSCAWQGSEQIIIRQAFGDGIYLGIKAINCL